MINHVRTIILNKSSSIAGVDTGLAHAEFIDPVYLPFIPPTAIKPYADQLFPAGATVLQQLEYLKGIMLLMHQPLFNPFITYFDPRITYIDKYKDDINNTISFNASTFINKASKLNINMPIMVSLFHNPHSISYLDDLYKLWGSNSVGVVPVMAALLAYVYKCDEERSK